jgi:copper chaperone CopZ
MTCSGCEEHVNLEINKLTGIIKTTVSYDNGNAIIELDQAQTDIEEIEIAIEKTGYKVTDKQENK